MSEVLPKIDNPTAGELSARTLGSLLVCFKKVYGEESLERSLKRAQLGPEVDLAYLRNESNWVSFDAGQRLIDVLDEDAGDPNFIRDAAWLIATRETLGYAFTTIEAYGAPKPCYQQLFQTFGLYNRVGEFKILKLTNTRLRFSYKSSVVEPNLRFSEYRMHQIASIPMIWRLKPAKAIKTQCQVTENQPEFIYELEWESMHRQRFTVLGGLVGTGLLGLGSVLFFNGFITLGALGALGLGGLTGLALGRIFDMKRDLNEQKRLLKKQTSDLFQSLEVSREKYDEIQKLNISLEQKVEMRTSELQRANQRLQELDKLKDRFLANISHELRTPLVALSATVQMILNKSLQDPQQQQRLLQSGMESIEDMLENVNDLLLKTRLKEGLIGLSWSEIEIIDFVERTSYQFETIATQKQTKLIFSNKISGSLEIYVDRAKLRKIINNLIGNALKFTKEGQVFITLDIEKPYCVISVADTGRGIPLDESDTIFEPFFQASNNPLREVQGTGIGLSLVKDLVELHHGKIEVESELDKGSCFRVYLPLGRDHVNWSQLDNSDLVEESDKRVQLGIKSFKELDLGPFLTRKPQRPNLLLVEDNPQIVQVLAYILKDLYNLHFAKDGQEGLEKAGKLKPNLIISDVMMPRKNGYELIKEIRQNVKLKSIPIILLTSKADRTSRLKGFSEGADEYLTKPFDNQEVLIRVSGLLDKKQLEAEFVNLKKMVALAQLAAGVSHEINNPLSYAKSASRTIEKIFKSIQNENIGLEEGMKMMDGAIQRVKEGTGRVVEITEVGRGFGESD